MKKIIQEHDETVNLTVVKHYEDHENRTESNEFRRVKEQLHKEKVPCWIGNGRCQGNLEVHHFHVEWSEATATDWSKTPGLSSPDQRENMMVLCEKHHRHKGFGIHMMPYSEFVMQKYYKEEALDDFEKAVYTNLYNK